MSSFLSRLWKRTTSTVSSSHSETTPSTQADVIPSIPSPTFLPAGERKIIANPDSLLASLMEQPEQVAVAPAAILGLRPSRRKASADAFKSLSTPQIEELQAQTSGGISASSDLTSSKATNISNRFISHLSQFATPGEWSTFGRLREHVSPALVDFSEQQHGTPSTPHEAEDKSRDTIEARSTSNRSVNASRPLTAQHTTSGTSHTTPIRQDRSPSRTTTSSKKNTPKTPDSRPRSSHSFFTTLPSRNLGHESPQTFGHLTPPEARMAGFNVGLGLDGGTSSYSPRAPDHPALLKSLTEQVGGDSSDHPTSSSRPALSPDDFQSTYPPHRRSSSWAKGSGDGKSFSLPFTFGKTSRPYSNLPKAQQIFPSRSSSSERRTSSTPHTRSRPSTGSSKNKGHERRMSAEWNARQATEEFSWPALVSREILRLSFGGAGSTESGRHPNTRGENVPDMPNLGHVSSPVPAVSPPNPPSTGHPISFEGSDVDGVLSVTHPDQLNGRLISGEVEAGSMPVKDSNPSVSTTFKTKAADRSTPPLASTSDPTSSSPALLQIPPSLSVISPTPETSPLRPSASMSDSKNRSSPILQIPAAAMTKTPTRSSSAKGKGKRKADDSNITPPDQKKDNQHATFAPVEVRPLRVSDSSHAPSSFQNKRARISAPLPTASQSREAINSPQAAASYGSWSSRTSFRSTPHHHPSRTPSRAASSRSANHSQQQHQHHQVHRASSDRRTSISQMSIPISALVSPHAPSISKSSKFHMQDPRKPPKIQSTGWSLRFKEKDEAGSPIHAWFFFVGFVLFPLWWAASIMRTPKTRLVGGSDTEKAVPLDDPQIEHDAKCWRFRCRIMSIISLVTYIPFIICVAVFVP